ncbi:hypothetical protein CXB51_003601 [Gossypium anomalum]|uniref:DUF7054 domain-containing protein n=1 Tax=Gossypium anomalum TaxID=47600 RepID=A0A8J5ZXV8_9ROSI|nr:hypothetical protein CXB51_003601 [Gossypium anomalum]
MVHYKQKKNLGCKGNRLLISVSVLGSCGPIRFVVNEELVGAVIDIALKSYAREALSPCETIGSIGARNFMLCKKPSTEKKIENNGRTNKAISRKATGNWKAWINKSLNLKISSH